MYVNVTCAVSARCVRRNCRCNGSLSCRENHSCMCFFCVGVEKCAIVRPFLRQAHTIPTSADRGFPLCPELSNYTVDELSNHTVDEGACRPLTSPCECANRSQRPFLHPVGAFLWSMYLLLLEVATRCVLVFVAPGLPSTSSSSLHRRVNERPLVSLRIVSGVLSTNSERHRSCVIEDLLRSVWRPVWRQR